MTDENAKSPLRVNFKYFFLETTYQLRQQKIEIHVKIIPYQRKNNIRNDKISCIIFLDKLYQRKSPRFPSVRILTAVFTLP